MERIVPSYPFGEADLAGRELLPQARIFGDVQVNMFRLHHHGVEDTLELLVEIDVPDPGDPLCVLFGETMPEPYDFLGRRVLDEERLAAGGVGVPGREQQRGLLLVDAAEVEQFGVLAEGGRGVTAAGVFVVGDEHGHGLLRHLADHVPAVAGVKFG